MNTFIVAALVCFYSGVVHCDEPLWESLSVTWNEFNPAPLTKNDAIAKGFQNIDSQCKSGKFLGLRYQKPDDSLILIYDITGYIAGIQTAIPYDLMKQVKTSLQTIGSTIYQEDTIAGKKYVVQTAYFIDPNRICGSGRQAEEFKKEIGTDLYLQNGSHPLSDSLRIPKYESQQINTHWTKGGCFPTMGVHYWLDIAADKDCHYFHPGFLLYNRGKLTGFGFANPGNFQFSKVFEHPPKQVLQKFIVPYTTCLDKEFDTAGGFSTTHYYFNVKPENLKC